MMFVIPKLTSKPEIFGIYTVCISLNIFFSYSDFGFLNAGQKFAAEYYAKNEKNKEAQVLGFILFLLLIFLLISSLIIIAIATRPSLIIKSLSIENFKISRDLLTILAFSSPIIFIQRFNSIVYSIRLEDYVYQGFDIIINILKIISIGYFINRDSYDITNYYLFSQILTFLGGMLGTIYAFYRFQINLNFFLRSIRFSKEMFDKTKSLAFSGILLTLAWVLYYELDSIILSKFYDLKIVAYYAVGFVFLSFTRNLYNILYSPFYSRFNHFIGLSDLFGFSNLYKRVIKFTFPLAVFPPIIVCFYMEDIIHSWLGIQYVDSIYISQIFIIVALINALIIPNNYLILAKEENRQLRITALILPAVFFLSLVILFPYLNGSSLAISKLITIFLSGMFTFYFTFKTTEKANLSLYYNCIKNSFLSILFLILYFYTLPNSISEMHKSTFTTFKVILQIFLPIIISISIYYFNDKEIRITVFNLIKSYFKKFQKESYV